MSSEQTSESAPVHAVVMPLCLICWKPVPDYEPEYCCSGFGCGCHGQPSGPCCCSRDCEDAVYSYIGKSLEDRRLLAGIAKWSA
jgi:hypothetical protein